MLRAFKAGSGSPVPIRMLTNAKLRLKIGEESQDVPVAAPGNSQVIYLRETAGGAELGAQLEVALLVDSLAGTPETTQGMLRYAWFRPTTGFAVDYSLANFGVVMQDWCDAGCELSVIPASLRAQYRVYGRSGSWYFFPGVFVGPNLALAAQKDDSDAATEEGAGPRVNGLLFGASVNLNGFEVGFGGLYDWEQPKLNPVFLLSISEAVWRGLGLSGQFPKALAETGGD